MHLSSISIKGFKSFPERTNLVFSPGVSVIVGPNGCGKSNVTDAVLWALGEQSPLSVRGQSMQDMIYAGGEGVGPSRFAEVEVVLAADDDASDGSSASPPEPSGSVVPGRPISIARRLERGGEGSYRLNGARARLADVIEVLSDANLGREMHSVISQGRVEEIVLSAPRERRLLVEEAAGLGKHRKRRRRAQLKLERTQDNLDRALDVEREARKSLRPLKRQAEAADIHSRLEREAAELRARLLASELRGHDDELAAAERAAGRRPRGPRRARCEARRRRPPPHRDRGAARRARVRAHRGLGSADRGARCPRADLGPRGGARGPPGRAPARDRATPGGARGARRRARRSNRSARRRRSGERRDRAHLRIAQARVRRRSSAGAGGDAGRDRGAALAAVREAADRAAQIARRVEDMLGSRAQDSLSQRLERESELVAALGELCEAAAGARDAVGERAAGLERRMLGESREDAVTERLRACSREEAELQTQLRTAGEAVTSAEVRVAHLGDRRAEAVAELTRIGATLGRELAAAESSLEQDERAEIELKLERLGRRREQLGPVNPLAAHEYEQALAHVESLEAQRTDLETALAELQGLIRETDRKIHAAFEETFAATERNFEELVEHLFPGGRGRLRLVDDRRGPKPVLGGAEAGDAERAADPDAGGEAGGGS